MKEKPKALVVLCKCGESHKTYGIRAEETSPNNWTFTWAFPIKEESAKREGYDHSSISGNISYGDEYPGCPYCGGHQLTVCSCGHLNCTILKNGVFVCEWCGNKGELGDYSGERISAGSDI